MADVNLKTAITLVITGGLIILVSIPLYLEKVRMNSVYGIRIRKAFESEELWYKVNGYGAKALMVWAVFLMATGMMCLYIPDRFVLTVARMGFMSIVVPVLQILRYAKRL